MGVLHCIGANTSLIQLGDVKSAEKPYIHGHAIIIRTSNLAPFLDTESGRAVLNTYSALVAASHP